MGAQMAAALNLAPQVPISKTLRELKELQVARQALITDQTRLLNRIKTQVVALVVQQGKARLKRDELRRNRKSLPLARARTRFPMFLVP